MMSIFRVLFSLLLFSIVSDTFCSDMQIVTPKDGMSQPIDSIYMGNVFLGGLLILLIYNTGLYVISKVRVYVYYLYFLACNIGIISSINDYAHLLFESRKVLELIFAILFFGTLHSTIIFARYFLLLRENTPLFDKWLGAVQWFFVVGMVSSIFLKPQIFLLTCLFMILLSCPVGYAALLRLKQGFKPARLFLFGFSVFVIAMCVYILALLNLFQIYLLSNYIFVALLLESLLFALAISYSHRLNEMSRVDERNVFIGMISHELRTPLQSIGSSIDLLALKMPKDDRVFNRLRDATAKLERQVKDLTDYSMLESRSLKFQNSRFNASKIVTDIVDECRSAAVNKGLNIRSKIEEDVIIVSDPYRLQQVISNLIGNAIKFTNTGFIDVEMTFSSDWPSKLRLVIKDTGIGMEPKYVKNIYEPFSQFDQTNKRDYTGMGMGLSIVHQLIKRFGGTIKVDSILGVGTTFKIGIPVESAWITINDKRALTQESGFGNRMLVIDDLLGMRTEMSAMIDMLGYQCDLAESGKKGIALLKNKKYSLIFLDINMPEMNGFEVAESIRNSVGINKQTPIIWISATSPENFSEEQKRNFSGFLEKPVRADKLQIAIKNTIEK